MKLINKIKAEYAKSIRQRSSKEVYDRIKNSTTKNSKMHHILLNLFPNIIQNLINLTRDSKFSVKESKTVSEANSFHLLHNSSKDLSKLIYRGLNLTRPHAQ